MNKKEFAVLADCIRSYYPRERLMPTKEATTLWYEALKDLDFDLAMMAVKKHSFTSKWSPTIAEIRESAVSITSMEHDWSDGWQEVLTAIRRYGYTDERGALASMSPLTRDIVKRLGWQHICDSGTDELTALRANFRMIYEQKSQNMRTEMQLPTEFTQKVNEIIGESTRMIE